MQGQGDIVPKADASGIASMLPSEAYCFVTWMGEEAIAAIKRELDSR